MWRRAEELEDLRVRLVGLARELLARQDEQLLARKDREPALELLCVAAASEIRVVPPGVTEIAGLADEALLLSTRPFGLRVDRLLEREGLAAKRDLVLVVRESAVDRIPEHRDQLRVRNRCPHALRRERVEQVAGARLADEAIGRAKWEMAAVPASPAAVMAIEVADLLPGGPGDPGMPAQVGVERGCARLLRPEDQERGQRPGE